MADEIVQSEQPSVQLVVDEKDLKTLFANAYRIYTTAEEVVVDLGFNHARSQSPGRPIPIAVQSHRSRDHELREHQAIGWLAYAVDQTLRINSSAKSKPARA